MTHNLYYEFIDNKSQSSILLLHGWGCNKAFMKPLCTLTKYNYLLLDLPGFGKSIIPKKPYYLDDYANDIIDLLYELNIKINYIVGHSFGGKLAIKLNAKLNDIKGLILISPSIFHKIRGPKYYVKIFTYKLFKKISFLKKYCANFGSEDYKSLDNIMKKTMSNIINESVAKILKSINIPVLLLFGKNDNITPLYLGKRIRKKIKDCALIIIEGDHFAYLSNKETVIRIIESLVDSTC